MKTINVISVRQINVSDRLERIPTITQAGESSAFDDACTEEVKEQKINTVKGYLSFDRGFVNSQKANLGQLIAAEMESPELASTFKVAEDPRKENDYIQAEVKTMWAAKNGDAEAMVNIIIRNARAELELRILSADRSTEIKDRSCKNLEKKIRSLRNENSMLKSKSKMVTQVALIGIAVMAVTQVLTVVVLG